jgi:hypothetical protein
VPLCGQSQKSTGAAEGTHQCTADNQRPDNERGEAPSEDHPAHASGRSRCRSTEMEKRCRPRRNTQDCDHMTAIGDRKTIAKDNKPATTAGRSDSTRVGADREASRPPVRTGARGRPRSPAPPTRRKPPAPAARPQDLAEQIAVQYHDDADENGHPGRRS